MLTICIGKIQKGNLHAWQHGQSGNPVGRPKLITLSEAYRRKLAEIDASDPERRTYAQLIADHLVRLAAGLAGSGKASAIAAQEIAAELKERPANLDQLMSGLSDKEFD